MDDFKLIPHDKIPFRVMRPRVKRNYPISEKGRIIINFIENNYKIAYIQLDSQRKMELLASNLIGAVNRWGTENIKIRQHTPSIRVYLLKIDQINESNYDNNLLDEYVLISTNTFPIARAVGPTLIREFIEKNYKLAYLEFETKTELRKAYKTLYSAARRISKNVKVYLYSYYNRIYLERTDLDISGDISKRGKLK